VETATVSRTFAVTIPPQARQRLGLRPGQDVHVFAYDDRIQIIPVRSAAEMRGFLHGMCTDFDRESDREFTK
jgi:AbrB family looped-hinge helix DNA binding protein